MVEQDRDQLITDLRELVAETGTKPTITQVTEQCEAGVREYVEVFGSWYDALDTTAATADIDPPRVDRESLLTDLKRLATGAETVTKDDIQERGTYRYEEYQQVFGSIIIALEAASIEPTTQQYNFAAVEPPRERAETKNVRYLRRNGPTPSSEMPLGSAMSDRNHGMWKFSIRAGRSSADAAGGRPEPVYYLKDEHDPETVIRTFFDANEQMRDAKSYHSLIQAVSDHHPDWGDIAKGFLPELVENSGQQHTTDPGILYVQPTDETTANAARISVTQPTARADSIDGVGKSEAYVWGLPDDREAVWQQTEPGDVVLVNVDGRLYGFNIGEHTRDWDATTDIWAEYEDGIRVAGPDRPWPYLLVGTTGGEFVIDFETFESAVEADLSDTPVVYLGPETVSPVLDGEHWQFERSAVRDEERAATSPARTSTEADGGTVHDGPAESESATDDIDIDATVAALAKKNGRSFVEAAVKAHLKRAVDGIDPITTAVTADETAPITAEFGSNRPLIEALCGTGATYASPAAFVEDALRTELGLPVGDRELTITVDTTVARLLEELAQERDSEPSALLAEQARALVTESSDNLDR